MAASGAKRPFIRKQLVALSGRIPIGFRRRGRGKDRIGGGAQRPLWASNWHGMSSSRASRNCSFDLRRVLALRHLPSAQEAGRENRVALSERRIRQGSFVRERV